jgi:NAD(P)-dependent dehydrogenase (short-subunit alcohol dehydrogenase family)
VGKYMIDEGIKGSIIMVASMSGVIVNRPQKQSAYNAVSCIFSSSSHPQKLIL